MRKLRIPRYIQSPKNDFLFDNNILDEICSFFEISKIYALKITPLIFCYIGNKFISHIRRAWGPCWMIAEGGEGENLLPFSLTAPKRGGRLGEGGGGIPASFPSRSLPPKQPFQPTPMPSPGSHQEVCEKS